MHLTPPATIHRHESDRRLPMLVWRFPGSVRGIGSGPLGGGIGSGQWAINATVDKGYTRTDPDIHLGELARDLGLAGPGFGMLTAVDVGNAVSAADGRVSVVATVGLGHPTWAAAPDGDLRRGWRPDDEPSAPNEPASGGLGTINLIGWIPVSLSDAALVNAVVTATEAKTQALWEHGVKATGTASDALFVVSPALNVDAQGVAEAYGGPRSVWGARLARAVHAAVGEGIRRWFDPVSR